MIEQKPSNKVDDTSEKIDGSDILGEQNSSTTESFPSEEDSVVGEDSVSEEEGLKSAESVFKEARDRSEDSALEEDREFMKYLRFRKRAKELGIDDPSFTTIYQGGIHISDSTVENSGNFVGNDQLLHPTPNNSVGGFSGEPSEQACKDSNLESIERIFDECDSTEKRSFMIALAALNGCNYRIVIETSKQLLSIIQPQAELVLEDEG